MDASKDMFEGVEMSIEDTLRNEIESYKRLPKINSKSNVIEFWISQKYQFPLLFKLGLVLLSIPASESSVERSFSILKWILSSQRMEIKGRH